MIRSRVRSLLRRDPIEVACATDRRTLPHCATTLHSLLVSQRRPLQVHLLATAEVSDESIGHLTRMVTEHAGTLAVHRSPAALPERVPMIDNGVIVSGPLDPQATDLGDTAAVRPWHPQAEPSARDLYWEHREQTPWAAENALTHPMREFFDGLRITRHQHYEAAVAPTRTRSRAVITSVYNEAIFLPIWLAYYSRFFAAEDIYVLDHQTTDGSTDGDGFVRVPIEFSSALSWERIVASIQALQHELLERYEMVLVADADEIVAPHPDWGSLADYLDRFDEDFVNCLGYEVLHLPDEAPLDAGRPLLEQRRWWYPNDGYDKPALATVPMRWQPGFHSRDDAEINLDPDLRMIHLHRIDYAICLDRHHQRLERSWDQRDLSEGWGVHNRVVEEREFERWFYEDSCFEEAGIHVDPEPIPSAWRRLL